MKKVGKDKEAVKRRMATVKVTKEEEKAAVKDRLKAKAKMKAKVRS